MVPLRFVKKPPQGTERKCIRQEKKYEASEVRRLIIKAYTMAENFLNWCYIKKIHSISHSVCEEMG